MQIPKLFLILTLFFLAKPLFAETTFRSPVCGTQNYFLASAESVISLLETLKLNRLQPGEKPSFSDRVRCGVPGEAWNVCTKCSKEKNEAAFKKAVPMLSSAEHRDWHKDWHRVRQEFDADGINSQPPEKAAIDKWKKQGIIPDDVQKFALEHKNNGSVAGEDFFYMHRQMIKMLQIEMTDLGEACIAPWEDLPKTVTDSQ